MENLLPTTCWQLSYYYFKTIKPKIRGLVILFTTSIHSSFRDIHPNVQSLFFAA